MKMLAAALLVLSAVSLSAQDAVFSDVKQYVQAGDKTRDIKATLAIGAESVTVTRNAQDKTVIAFADMTGATYDRRQRQRKSPLGVPMAGWQPKVQHFLTIKYKGDFVELELGKDIAARVVSTLEARSGQTVEKTGS